MTPIEAQFAILSQHDWGRNIDWTLSEKQLLLHASCESEGYQCYVVVFDQTMVIDHEESPSIDHSIPVIRVLEALSKQRNGRLTNYRASELDRAHYRRSKESVAGMKQLWASQGCPTGFMLIPAQLGNKHAGKSVLRAREVMRGSEFPLDGDGVFDLCFYIRFLAGQLEFSCDGINNPMEAWGSASGFIL